MTFLMVQKNQVTLHDVCIILNQKIQITVSPIFRAVRSYLSNGNRDAVVLFESQRLRAII